MDMFPGIPVLTFMQNGRQYNYVMKDNIIRKPRCSDISPLMLLNAIHFLNFGAFEHLCETFPPKVVLKAIERDDRNGLIDYGVSIMKPWITPKGREILGY